MFNITVQINSLVRQLQIDMIADEVNPILEFFNDLLSKLNIIETNVYHNNGGEIIYYIIESNVKIPIFFQDAKNNIFWCNYNHYWLIIESKFVLNYDDVQCITKYLVESVLNIHIEAPMTYPRFQTRHYNISDNNPFTKLMNMHISVEKILNGYSI